MAGSIPGFATNSSPSLVVSLGPAFGWRFAWHRIAWFVRKKPLGAVGLLVILAFVTSAAFSDALAPHDPNHTDIVNKLQAPSPINLLGTDNLGRDILSRIMFGARLSLTVALSATFVGTVAGGSIGLLSALSGGRLDLYVQRIADALMAFPNLILLLALVAALGPSYLTVIAALAVGIAPGTNRIVRSVALSIKQANYIEAAEAIGASRLRILFLHLAPNCLAPWLIYASTVFGGVIVAEATLAFLGLGVPPPEPSWGRDLTAAQNYFLQSPWVAIWPGVALSLVVFSANLLGDALRDVLDPKFRGR